MNSQNTEIEDTAEAIEALFPRIARRIFTTKHDDPVSDLPIAQMKLCTLLQNSPLAVSSIADEFGITISAATQLADRLERAGLVHRVINASDRRVRLVRLTQHGTDTMAARRVLRRQLVRCVIATMTEEERSALLSSLLRLLEATWETRRSTMM